MASITTLLVIQKENANKEEITRLEKKIELTNAQAIKSRREEVQALNKEMVKRQKSFVRVRAY